MKTPKYLSLLVLALSASGFLLSSFPLHAARFDVLEESTKNDPNNPNNLRPFGNMPYQSELQQRRERITDHYQTFMQLLQQEKFDEARAKVNEWISKNPKESGYYNFKAMLDVQAKDTKKAIENFKKAIELDPKNQAAYMGISRIAFADKQWNDAKKYTEQVLNIEPKNIAAHLLLADIAMAQQDMKAVEKVLLEGHKQLQGKEEGELTMVSALGRFYLAQNQASAFLSLAEKTGKKYQNNTSAQLLLAEAQLANRNIDEAESLLRKAVAADAKNVPTRLMLMRLLGNKPNQAQAVGELADQILALDQKQPEAIAIKHAFLIKQQDFKQAEALAAQTEQSFPKGSIAHILRGDTFFAQKMYDKALSEFQKAYDMTPNDQVLESMLRTLYAQNDTKGMIVFLQKLHAKNNKHPLVLMRLAMLMQQTGDMNAAIAYYSPLLELQPDNTIALNNLAMLYAEQNNIKGLELAEKAYKKAPKSPVIADTYGYVLLKLGKAKEGLKILEETAKAVPPQATEVHLHLAEAYIANGNKQAAQAVLQKVIEQNNADKNKAQDMLNKL